MRKLGIAVAIVIAIVVVVIAVFAAAFDVNKYHGTIQAELQEQLGRPVQLGDMHLGLFPPRFRVRDVTVADDPAFNAQTPFLKARELDVSVKLLPLLKKQVAIRSLDLDRPVVDLIRNRDGSWNFASLGKPAGNEQSASREQPPQNRSAQGQRAQNQRPQNQPATASGSQQAPQSSGAQQFSLGRLAIRDGELSLVDEKTSPTPTVYDHIDATLRGFSPNKPFALELAAHLPGSGISELRLAGDGGPIDRSQPQSTPFHGTLVLNQVGIAQLSKFMNSQALAGVDGTLNGETQIDNNSGRLTAKGETDVQSPKYKGSDLGYPIHTQYDLTNELASGVLTLRDVVVKLGSTPLQANGTINTKSTPSQLALNLKADNVGFGELAKLAAISGQSLPVGVDANGNISADVQARGAANKPALNGVVSTTPLQISGKDLPEPVQVQPVRLQLTPAQIQSNAFNISQGGTTINAQLTLNNYAASNPSVNATVKAPNAQFPAILAMAKLYGVQGVDKVSGQGVINLDLRASGPIKSLNAQEIMKTLNGTMGLNLNDVKYSGANVGHELSSLAGFLKSSPLANGLSPNGAANPPQGVTNIQTVTGNIVVKNGIAQTNDLLAQTDFGKIALIGSANLADQSLNLKANAVLSKAASQSVGGSQIGGFAKTALANNQGELVIPAVITGTFSNPKFAPDFQQAAQMKVKGMLPNFNNPASLTGTIQKLTGGIPGIQAQQARSNQQPSQSQNPAQQLLGMFGGKKKP
jgi:AsmA protein